jgi:FimV-like protein
MLKNTKIFTRQVAILWLLLVYGCAMIPTSIPNADFAEQAEVVRRQVTANQEPVAGPISMYEAIARALKYNLDFHLERAEKILALNDLDVSQYELLPQLVGNLGYAGRDTFSGSSSRSLITGSQSLQTSTSSDRDVRSADLSLTWNILDFGISYFRAKQAADRVLIAEEETRSVVNRLVQDTRAAYWRAVSNDRLIAKMEGLLERVNQALADSQRVEIERLDRPLTALTYQRELIGIKRELEELQRELSLAKIQLAALMNLPLGESYSLALPDRTNDVKTIGISPQLMEQIALENRPEIREVSYQKRINSNEAKTAILSLFPNLNLNFGKNYNSNSFLFENDWLGYGSRITGDLINLTKIPATNREFNAREKVLDARRLTLSMAIMTQVYVSLARYEFSKREFDTARNYYTTQQKILNQFISAVSVDSVSQQTLIREEMNMMVAEVKYDIAYSELENSYAAIFAALGIDILPGHAFLMPLDSLENILETKLSALSLDDEIIGMKVTDSPAHSISSPPPAGITPGSRATPEPAPQAVTAAVPGPAPAAVVTAVPEPGPAAVVTALPEPVPAPAAVVTAVPEPAPAADDSPRVSSYAGEEYGPTNIADRLWSIANQVRPDTSVSVQQMMFAILRANPAAFENNNINGLRHGRILRIPDKDEILNTSAETAMVEIRTQNARWQER